MVQTASASMNIWVAASDGDLDRVQYLIEEQGLSPNIKDSNSYTPMHAAASYAHLDLLTYLLGKGGDINIADEEGETPLFTVESEETARWLVQRGADPGRENNDGRTAADFLQDDHPEISIYLRSLLPPLPTSTNEPLPLPTRPEIADDAGGPSQLALETFASGQTSDLLEESRRIMLAAETSGEDPEPRLRELVESAVRDGISFGGQVGDGIDLAQEEGKRRRTNGDGGPGE